MDTAQIVNRIIEKLGGNRVEFVKICVTRFDILYVSFVHAGNKYEARVYPASDYITVGMPITCQRTDDIDAYANWVEGVLNGSVRNDAGELVKS